MKKITIVVVAGTFIALAGASIYLSAATVTTSANAQAPRSKMIAFFDGSECPENWSPYANAMGRYVVGLTDGGVSEATVGTALADQEMRSAGEHAHPYTRVVLSGNNNSGFKLSDNGTHLSAREIVRERNSHSEDRDGDGTNDAPVAGTNAPYVQLMACREN